MAAMIFYYISSHKMKDSSEESLQLLCCKISFFLKHVHKRKRRLLTLNFKNEKKNIFIFSCRLPRHQLDGSLFHVA
jgi:hypothetical protein